MRGAQKIHGSFCSTDSRKAANAALGLTEYNTYVVIHITYIVLRVYLSIYPHAPQRHPATRSPTIAPHTHACAARAGLPLGNAASQHTHAVLLPLQTQ